MPNAFFVLVIACGLAVLAHRAGYARANALLKATSLPARPHAYGWWTAMGAFFPALVIIGLYIAAVDWGIDRAVMAGLPADIQAYDAERLALFLDGVRDRAFSGVQSQGAVQEAAAARMIAVRDAARGLLAVVVALGMAAGAALAYRRIGPRLHARVHVERAIRAGLLVCSAIAILTTVGIVASLLFESLQFFARVPLHEFLFGLQWSPQTALRADQVGQSGSFGAVPLFYGTAMITLIAMLVAGPIGLFSAIHLSEYADARTRAIVKPVLELLAGVPTVVYGFFALLTVGPFIRGLAEAAGLDVPTQSALAAGLVMGIMIIPFVSSLSDDVINAVPQHLRDGALALGATRAEMISQVVLPAALPGIMGAMLLAISRAVGETMIVVMAAGYAANMPINPLDSVTTVTVQIVNVLKGDQEFDSAKTLSAFALGLVLFTVTLAMNIVALHIVQRYRERYD